MRLLAEHYLDLHRRRYRKPGLHFSDDALAAMRRYGWPGNVRELRNAIEQAVIMASGDAIEPELLRLTSTLPRAVDTHADAADAADAAERALNLADAERELVVRALAETGGNVTQAARLLGVSRDTLRYRIEKHALKPGCCPLCTRSIARE